MYTLYNCKNLLESTGTVLVIIFSVVTIFLNYTKRTSASLTYWRMSTPTTLADACTTNLFLPVVPSCIVFLLDYANVLTNFQTAKLFRRKMIGRTVPCYLFC